VAGLTWEQVRAWRVARNHLDTRAPRRKLLDVVSDVGAIHAQVQSAAELSLWARVEDVTSKDIREALWKRRTLVRTWSVRGTLHLHRASDLPLYAAALSTNDRWWKGAWLRFVGLSADELDALLKAIRSALTDRPATREELTEKVARKVGPHVRERMASGWGELLKPAAFRGWLCSGPPRGQNVTFVRPDRWLRAWKEVDGDRALEEVFRRYLRTFGPATHEDFAAWWGIPPPPARRVRLALDSELEQVDVEGTTGWVGPKELRRMQELEAPSTVRLLPNFDAYVMGFRQRERMVEKRLFDRVFRKAGWISPVVLVDGRIAGVWKHERGSRGIEVGVQRFGRLGAADRKGIEEEADRLGRFLGEPARVSITA
jgi:winged helix DNA-binding protein